MSYARSYRWAANPIKLGEAITDLVNAQKLDKSVVIDEETIKARYIIRKGQVIEIVAPEVEADMAPVGEPPVEHKKAKKASKE